MMLRSLIGATMVALAAAAGPPAELNDKTYASGGPSAASPAPPVAGFRGTARQGGLWLAPVGLRQRR